MRISRFVGAVLAFSIVSRSTFADPIDKPLSESLFNKGRQLWDKGDVAAACAAFEESERLDPGHVGTALNLAACHEQLKKWAEAWEEYSFALRLSKQWRVPASRIGEKGRSGARRCAIQPR